MKKLISVFATFAILSGCSNSFVGYEVIETLYDKENDLYIELAKTVTFSSLETGVYVNRNSVKRTHLTNDLILTISVRGMDESYKFGLSPTTGCYSLEVGYRTGYVALPKWLNEDTNKELCFELLQLKQSQ